MTDRLGHKQTAAMFTLLVLGREVSNKELREIVGFSLDGKDLAELRSRQYVTTRTPPKQRAFAHTLTEAGLNWCRGEIGQDAPPAPKARSLLVPAMYQLLRGLHDYLSAEKRDLTDVFPQPELTSEDIAQRIAAAYRKLAGSSRRRVGLAQLRPMLDGIEGAKVNDVLKDLSKAGRVSLVPESDRKKLTAADHAAAIHIGGEDNHLIAIEAS